jgi:hypothetical protein
MKRVPAIAFAVVAGATLCAAQSPFTARVAPGAKTPGVSVTTASGGSGYLGSDNCAVAHTALPAQPFSGFAFNLCPCTTGTTGQAEALCLFFGSDDVQLDCWYTLTASATGSAVLDTFGSTIDTKMAVYPSAGSSACPTAAALACNDDAGATFQSQIGWNAVAGTQYTVQLGVFPGAACGTGIMNMVIAGPDPCGQKHDGETDNALGLTAGGEIGWLTVFDDPCVHFDSVYVAYGTLMFPGSVTNGNQSKIVIYTDADTDSDPTTGLTVEEKVTTTVQNGDTDILNKVYLANKYQISTNPIWILASADQVAGQFPASMDQDPPTHVEGNWVVGNTAGPGSLNTTTLTGNNVGPFRMDQIGFTSDWLLQPDTTTTTLSGGPGTNVCFGDGSGIACPCGNTGAAGAGCANSVASGALLTATGTASVTSDSLGLSANNTRNDNGLFFQGNNTIGGGNGQVFGDGLRCCGGGVVRIQVVNPPGVANPATHTMTETATTNGPPGTILPGQKKCYQLWYRDPGAGSPCGQFFNLSNAVSVTWQA